MLQDSVDVAHGLVDRFAVRQPLERQVPHGKVERVAPDNERHQLAMGRGKERELVCDGCGVVCVCVCVCVCVRV